MKLYMRYILCAAWLVAASGYSLSLPFTDTFEAETIGANPTLTATTATPAPGSADRYLWVYGSANNIAGTGQCLQYHDQSASGGNSLLYKFATSYATQVSAARVDFSCAPVAGTSGDTYMSTALGEQSKSMTSSAYRFYDARLKNNGQIEFRAASGSVSVALNASNNAVSIFVNDYDVESIAYTGPDSSARVLPPNSVDFWLNGALKYSDLLFDIPCSGSGGSIYTTTNNIGVLGFNSNSTGTILDYVLDDISVTTLAVKGAGGVKMSLIIN